MTITDRDSWHAKRIEEPDVRWKEEQLIPAPAFRARRCLEVSEAGRREVEVDVAVEESVAIILNGDRVTDLPALPGQIKEMAVGFLIAEGFVGGLEDIVSIKEENGSVICRIGNVQPASWKRGQPGSAASSAVLSLKPVCSEMKMRAETLLHVVDQLDQRARIWRRTGATHSSIICSPDGEILASCEDVSRSTSVDKTVGVAYLLGIDLHRCALITSGRLSAAMVAKAARAGFPILASRSAPMDSGVELAERIGMTLVGFARRPNLYVYAGEERIV